MCRTSFALLAIFLICLSGTTQQVAAQQQAVECDLGVLPYIDFRVKSSCLSDPAKRLLSIVAVKLRKNPHCKLKVIGYGQSSEAVQQLSWERVNNVILYLIEMEGIAADRFIFIYGEPGDNTITVDLQNGTYDKGPYTMPSPFPSRSHGKAAACSLRKPSQH